MNNGLVLGSLALLGLISAQQKRQTSQPTQPPIQPPTEPAPAPEPTEPADSEIYTDDELRKLSDTELMARTLYGEGRSIKSDKELELIGHVIMNRVASSSFPNTIKGVILRPWQFSAWNEPITENRRETRLKQVSNQRQLDRMRQISRKVINRTVNPIPNVYHYVLNSPEIEIKNGEIIETPYDWTKGMTVVKKGVHLFLK